MAYLFRLVALSLLGLVVTYAGAYPVPGAEYGSPGWASGTPTPHGVCAYHPGTSYVAGGQYGVCQGSTGTAVIVLIKGGTCGPNSLLQGASCVCNSGYDDTGSSCVNNTQQKTCSDAKGGSDWFSGFKAQPSVGGSFCPSDGAAASCGATVTGGYCTIKAGVKSCAHEVKYTGATCTPPANPVDAPVNDPCKGSSGTVNGKTVCLPIGTDPAATTETTKTTSTTSTTGGGVDGNSPTSSGTSASTQCTGSQCTTTTTTTTTTTNGDGSTSSQTTTGTKTEPKEDYCTSNPKALECGGSSFGGSCSASFACEGDAVMCAIAKDQHIRNCTFFDKETSEGALFNTEKNKEGSQVTNEDKSISSASFDTSNALGGGSGSCIADKSITVMGWTGSIPFSTVCPHLAVFGNILLVVSFLLAGRIVARG